MNPNELYTRQEAADQLRIHLSYLARLLRENRIDVTRIGSRVLISRGALDKYINSVSVASA